MKYYVVSDPHGFYTPLHRALEAVGFFSEREEHRLVVCGDLFDRGGEALQMQDFITGLLHEGRLLYIRGNHEDLMGGMLQELAAGNAWSILEGYSHHVSNGTFGTALQLCDMTRTQVKHNPKELVRRMRATPFWRELLPATRNYVETAHYVFVHGWIPCLADGYLFGRPHYIYDENWRSASPAAWGTARWQNGMELCCKRRLRVPGKTVVVGHWHTSFGHAVIHHRCSEFGKDAILTPFRDGGIIALDACTAHSGFVNCVVLED